ncbi:HDOD domain-containing protein [uncultured Desulfuromonas sp.]|uniref:HDOD domain-containing protein n=1 Tax=uncultured Desulfuromonas sp. TaxID=181013 RepID=UPI002AAC469C|nr:HDOD domain-containing protein [uncultured Desulfuromonas sp.]
MGDSISNHIRKVREISAPPEQFGQLLQMIGDDNSDLTELVTLLELHPFITARLLQCANSAYFRQAGEIDNVRDAVIRVLGLSLTRSLTLAFLVSDSFDLNKVSNFDGHRHWFVALVTATMAREMAPRLKNPLDQAPALYSAGMLHNLGVAALAHCFPEQMNQALMTDTVSLSEKTRRLFHLDHYQAGALLIRSWNLPKTIVEPILHLRNPNLHGPSGSAVQLIRLCSNLANLLYKKEFHTLRNYSVPPSFMSRISLEESIFFIEGQCRTLDEISRMMSR